MENIPRIKRNNVLDRVHIRFSKRLHVLIPIVSIALAGLVFVYLSNTNKVDYSEPINWISKERIPSHDTLYLLSKNQTSPVIFLVAEGELDAQESSFGNDYILHKLDTDAFWNPRTCVRMPTAIVSHTQIYFRDVLIDTNLKKTDTVYSYDVTKNELRYMVPEKPILGNIYQKDGVAYFFTIDDSRVWLNKIHGDMVEHVLTHLPKDISEPSNLILAHSDSGELYAKYKSNTGNYSFFIYTFENNTFTKSERVKQFTSIEVSGDEKKVSFPTYNFTTLYSLTNVYGMRVLDTNNETLFKNEETLLKYTIGAI